MPTGDLRPPGIPKGPGGMSMEKRIEKYEILDEIGHGGMATVYRARDTKLDRLVALKVMHPHLRAAREARARFEREAKTVARLRHPGILEIYDFSGEESSEAYIATELLTGPTLRVFAEKTPDIPAEIVACLGIEIARALGAAHDAGVIHRDVKPENVLFHEARCIKLTDFGIAQMADAQSMTATGQVLGSPGHMAPEQIEGKDSDARTDLFALGTVLYFLAVGRLPFAGKNPHQVLKRIIDGDYTDPMRVKPTIGARLGDVLVRLLARDREQRIASAPLLEKALTAFLVEMKIDDPSAALREYLRDPATHAAEYRRRAIARGTELAEQALAARDVRSAGDHLNRVLAFDPTHARAIHLTRTIGRRHLRRRVLSMSALALALTAALVAGAVLWPTSPETTKPEIVASGGQDAAVIAILASGSLVLENDDGGEPWRDSGELAIAATENREDSAGVGLQTKRGDSSALRKVVFRPLPQNVTIAIDDGAPREFGPSYFSADLAPGPHRFRVTGKFDCCEDKDESIDIPSGRGAFSLPLALAIRPAMLLVKSNVPANVEVGNDLASGRALAVIPVPMRGLQLVLPITVTAAGHRVYTTRMTLRAGQLLELEVSLDRLEGTSLLDGIGEPPIAGGARFEAQ